MGQRGPLILVFSLEILDEVGETYGFALFLLSVSNFVSL